MESSLSIGDVAAMYGVRRSTLRWWEKLGAWSQRPRVRLARGCAREKSQAVPLLSDAVGFPGGRH
jgi:hypothetical protein